MRCKNTNYRLPVLIILALSLVGLSSNAIAQCPECPDGEGCGWTFAGDYSIPLTKGNGDVPATLDIEQVGNDLVFTFTINEVGGVQPQLWVGTNPVDFSTYTYTGNTEYSVPLSTFGECTDSQQLTIYVRALYIGGMTDKNGDKFVEETLVCECCECPVQECYCEETAWSEGDPYNSGGTGNWATYTTYDPAGKCVNLFAGQDINAGTVCFSPPNNGKVDITITLDNARFVDVPENVKIQDYELPPSGNPNIGGFDSKGYADPSEDSFTISVPANYYYGVHVDLEVLCDCDPENVS